MCYHMETQALNTFFFFFWYLVYMMNFEKLIVTIIYLHALPNNNISPNSIRKLTKGSSLGAVGMF